MQTIIDPKQSDAAEPRQRSKARSWGRGILWLVAISLTGGGLAAIPEAVNGVGFGAVDTARRAALGIALLTWLIASGRRFGRHDAPWRHRAAVFAVAAGVGSEMAIGSIIGSIVLVTTPLILGWWGLRLTWTMRGLMRALEASPAWQPAPAG